MNDTLPPRIAALRTRCASSGASFRKLAPTINSEFASCSAAMLVPNHGNKGSRLWSLKSLRRNRVAYDDVLILPRALAEVRD